MANEKLLIDLQNIDMNEVDTSDCTDVEDILSAVITYLSEQPIVDAVEVVHGQWVKYEDDRFNGYYADGRIRYRKVRTYYCDKCGYGTVVKSNYCSNCGAKMDGVGNG